MFRRTRCPEDSLQAVGLDRLGLVRLPTPDAIRDWIDGPPRRAQVFQWQAEATEPASYSRRFKPDYTLAIFPARFASEADAARQGMIAYLHLDAKYRAEDMRMIFGDETEDLDAEKEKAKATATYKRGDLLKMHTYNDSVRQTAGSYVVYPGTDTETRLTKFHEILPGVGAFVLKPGKPECRKALKSFLADVFRHQADQFTQYRHFTDVIHATVRERPVDYADGRTHRPGATCVLIYAPEPKGRLFHDKGLAYCHALRDDEARSPVRVQLGSLAGAVICGYTGGRTDEKTSLPWVAPILSCEMLSREKLKEVLKASGWPEEELPSSAAAYLLFRLGAPSTSVSRKLAALTPKGSYQAVSCTLEALNSCQQALA